MAVLRGKILPLMWMMKDTLSIGGHSEGTDADAMHPGVHEGRFGEKSTTHIVFLSQKANGKNILIISGQYGKYQIKTFPLLM